MISALKSNLTNAVRNAAFSAGALFTFAIGAAFITAAAWIFIAASQGVFMAALIIGLVYLGISMILLAIAGSGGATGSSRPAPRSVATEPSDVSSSNLPPLAQAFIFGLTSGLKADAARRK